ncbi:VQ motif-containing protein 29-like isoform X2 [Prosopis cineraria]|uniref:VQ motif-containing protein 29-like isoform X2 n=1 Tax=Prosopis cineraria TaxID=364024 RepID=UPI00240EF6BA|nr:VQ motif-containing protein 29-like isoform X2 [Prosopis cineraria]
MMQEYSSSHGSSVTDEARDVKHGSWLHSVRKPISKPCKKAPVAPMPPTPIKVYKVDPMNFRDLVQQLTGAPEFKPHHLQSVAPPTPMPVSSFVESSSRDIKTVTSSNFNWPPQAPVSNLYLQDLEAEAMGIGLKYQDISGTLVGETKMEAFKFKIHYTYRQV